MFVWQAHEGAVTSLAFGQGGQFLVSAGSDECVKVWEPFTGAEQFRISLQFPGTITPPFPLRWLTLSADGNWAVVHQSGQRLTFLDLVRERVATERDLVCAGALKRTPDGEAVLVLAPEGLSQARRYDFASLTASVVDLGRLSDYPHSLAALAFAPDNSRVAIGSTVRPWPPAPDGHITSVHTKSYEPEDLAFSADNEHLFALVGGKVAVYSLPHGIFKTKLKGHCGQITAMVLAPDGRRLWTASRDATVKCWDTHALMLDRTFRFDTGGLDCLAVSPDGNVAAVGSAQKGTVTVWDLN